MNIASVMVTSIRKSIPSKAPRGSAIVEDDFDDLNNDTESKVNLNDDTESQGDPRILADDDDDAYSVSPESSVSNSLLESSVSALQINISQNRTTSDFTHHPTTSPPFMAQEVQSVSYMDGIMDFKALACIMASIILMQSYIVVSYVGGFLEDDRQDYIKRLVLSLAWLVVIVQPSCLTAVALAQVLMKKNTYMENESDRLDRMECTDLEKKLRLTEHHVASIVPKRQFIPFLCGRTFV